MKKMLATTAAVLVGAVAMADVISSNIVGYNTKTTTAGVQDMYGVPFQNVGETTISIQDIKPVSGFSDGGDILSVWDPATKAYATYAYFNEVYDGDTVVGAGWGNSNQDIQKITLAPGQGFWLKTVSAASFTIAGEVVKADANTISLAAGKQTQCSSVFPVDASIQTLVPVSGFSDGGDILSIWDATAKTYATYAYFNEVYDGDTVVGAGWGNSNQDIQNVTLAAGQGFWLKTVSDAVLSFTAPAGL